MERREQEDDEERQASDRLIHRVVASGGGGAVGHGEPVMWPTVDGPLGLSEERSLEYARSFFRWGFFLLPFLWAVNCFYFWPVLRNRSSSSSSFQRIRHSMGLLMSLLGSTLLSLSKLRIPASERRNQSIGMFGMYTHNPLDVVGSAIGFLIFTVVLSSWALTFAIGGERLFGPVWKDLVMYNVAEKLGLTGWI
ncbi:putative gamma-secretase subunit PEN-2 [Dendrobium catenatum]|uniref:Putative gamma-secretase subunit PEN-2 n=1 Tax=Dendrobium catenatum TaxID=906689 RepID=A0A2I0W574_9ASPA|nr:putative gamma-secretase subunit PEN-2 [Dendrobium catenatum]